MLLPVWLFSVVRPASIQVLNYICLNSFSKVFFSCCAWTGEESRRKTGEVQAKFPTVSHLLFFLLLCALQQDSFISKLPLKNQVSTELRYLYWSWLTPHLNSDASNPAFVEVWARQLTAIKQKGQLPFLGAGWVFPRCDVSPGWALPFAAPRCGAARRGVTRPGGCGCRVSSGPCLGMNETRPGPPCWMDFVLAQQNKILPFFLLIFVGNWLLWV